MEDDFDPIVKHPHLLTIAGNFWPRRIDVSRFPPVRREYRVSARISVLVYEHQPESRPIGQIVFLHGLEGSGEAGYISSFAQAALLRGFGVHRANMRTCGDSESLCETSYHAGLTADTRFVLEEIKSRNLGPIFLCGFSLGGNVALKLAGELGETDLLSGTIAVSTPIDLAECVRALDRPSNRLYSSRFLDRLKARVRRMSVVSPESYNVDGIENVKSVWEFDDRYTAPLFGFGTAENYYATQSSVRFLSSIRVPALVICAKDDPLVPFDMYRNAVFQSNPALSLLATRHGGHLGFLSRRKPRFWLDVVGLNWIMKTAAANPSNGTNSASLASA